MDSISLAISIASISFSGGVLVGMFTAKFVGKKECKEKHDMVWAQIDGIRNCMTGGKIRFELRMVQPGELVHE